MSGTAYEVVTLSGTDTADTVDLVAAATPIYFVEETGSDKWSLIGATTTVSSDASSNIQLS